MADNKKIIPIDQLPEATLLNDTDAIMVVQNHAATMATDLGSVGEHINGEQTYSALTTKNKQIVQAINEIAGVELIGTIKAYESTIVLYDEHIKANSKIRVFFETFGMSAKDVKASVGQVIVKINPLEEDVKVLVQVT